MVLSASEILKLDVKNLATFIAAGKISAVEALSAYITRARKIHAATNAIIAWVPEAEEEAKAADIYLSQTGKTLGPLHGVPFTVKDHYGVVGLPLTMGLCKLKEKAKITGGSKLNSAVVVVLKAAGGICFAKTNMSQMGATWGGGNPAYGDTLNPWNTLRTSGGSSSGEGALVGSGASSFGIGSDVGGSVRIPAAFCGVAGLKPTAQRLTFNMEDGRTILNKSGDYSILAACGIIARHVDDLAEVFRALCVKKLWMYDYRVPPIVFNDLEYHSQSSMRIGYYIHEYTYPTPCPSVVRAMKTTVVALSNAGHTMIPFTPHSDGYLKCEDVNKILTGLTMGGSTKKSSTKEKHLLTGEKLHPDLIAFYILSQKNKNGFSDLKSAKSKYHSMISTRDKLRDRFSKAWRTAGIDVLLCPAFAFPAPPVEEVRNLSLAVRTTQIYNLLDYPAGVVPVTHVTEEDLSKPWNPSVDFAKAALRSRIDSKGLPISLQVVALPWREEMCLRGLRAVEKVSSFDTSANIQLAPTPRRSKRMGSCPQKVQPKL